jgi:metal-sulfur cluster biosynthetic enzyme
VTVAALDTALEQSALDALRGVLDPELDESLVDLGFVDYVRVDEDRVTVGLRLPTFWCAPNFAYLMASDARDQVRRVAGGRDVHVVLKDHFASDEISAGVSADQPLATIFPGQIEGEDLSELRRLFQSKAYTMRLEQLVQLLLDGGLAVNEVAALRMGDVLAAPERGPLVLRVGHGTRSLRGGSPLLHAYLDKRSLLGLGVSDETPLVTDVDGTPIGGDRLLDELQRARRQRVSIAFNSMFCRGMLDTRYAGAEQGRSGGEGT